MDIVSYILNKNSIGEIQDEVDQIEEDLVDINTELDKKVNKDELGSSAYLDAPAIGDAADNEVVLGCDSRLTDARTPVAHTHLMNEIADLPTLGTVVTYDIPVMGDALPNEVVMGDDTRLTDNRDPNPHNHVVADITDFPTLGTAAAKDYTSTYDPTSSDLVTGEAVGEAINSLPNPMVFKGSLGDGGTITQLPAPVAANEGFTYKVITEGTYAGVHAGIGDMFTCGDPDNDHIFEWVHFPSGDEPGGTVMSVKIQGSGAIAVDDESAITTSGVRTISHNDSGVTAGTYTSVTVDEKGHVTAGSNPDISYNDLTDKPTLGTAAALDVPASGNASSSQVVKGDDSRLTDARTPVSHTHTLSEITDAGTAAALDVATSGDASTSEVVKGDDSRLTDARNAADVSPWAKASTKPSYTASEVGALADTTKYAGASTAGGAATSAEKLTNTSKIGDTNKPVYFTANGVPVAISYTIDKSVPSNAVFTDTNNAVTQSASTTSDWRKVLLHYINDAASSTAVTTSTNQVYAAVGVSVQPSTGTLAATKFSGDISGCTGLTKSQVTTALGYTPPTSDTNTTYTVATGDANGQIKVTPSSGSAYNVSVKGLGSNAYTSTSYLPLAGGTMTGNLTFSGSTGIQYTGTKATYGMIKFKDNTSDTYGNGIIIGGGGLTVIGAGESADTVAAQFAAGDENMHIAADSNVYIYSNVNNGYSSRKTFTFGTDGTLTATKFSGPLTGNVTGNCSGSSGSCTGNAATATSATTSSLLTLANYTAGNYSRHTDAYRLKANLTRDNYCSIGTGSGGGILIAGNWTSSAYNAELYFGMGDNLKFYYRGVNNNTYTSWYPIGRFTQTAPTTGQVVITDGTTGGIKSSGYTIAKSVPSNAVFTDTNTWRGIQDNLTSSTNTTESLSAKQGYLLANGSARDSTKLPLAGGTMTGTIVTPGDDTKGLEPATNNYGRIGSSDKYYYQAFISQVTTGTLLRKNTSSDIGGTAAPFRYAYVSTVNTSYDSSVINLGYINSNIKWQGLSASAAKPADYSVILLYLKDNTINSKYFCRIYYQNSTSTNQFDDSIILLNSQTRLYCESFTVTFNSSGVSISTPYYGQIGTTGVYSGNAFTIAGILGMKR